MGGLYNNPTKTQFYPHYSFNGLFFGIEHEVDKNRYGSECSSYNDMGSDGVCDGHAIEKLWGADRVFVTTDGLDHGLEVIFMPMTYGYIATRAPFKTYFKMMDKRGYVNNTVRPGMHIHVSKRGLGTTPEEYQHTLANLFMFWASHWEQYVLRFTRRLPTKERYGGMGTQVQYDFGQLTTEQKVIDYLRHATPAALSHCMYFGTNDDGRGTMTTVEQFFSDATHQFDSGKGKDRWTIETRAWASTTNYNHFMATVEFLYDSIKQAKKWSLDDARNITWQEYMNSTAHYRHLNKVLEELGIIPIDKPVAQTPEYAVAHT